MTTEVECDVTDELMALETELTIFELLVLFMAAVALEGACPWEPMPNYTGEEIPLHQAPFLSEKALLELARQQRLLRLGLVTLYSGEPVGLRATEKGMEAVKWWVGALEDLGFTHESLRSL